MSRRRPRVHVRVRGGAALQRLVSHETGIQYSLSQAAGEGFTMDEGTPAR